MIVSASRRTDLPGFYGEWLLNRVRAGYAVSVNPFNPRQRRRVPLDAEAVDAFVFWTRDPGRLAELTAELEGLGHRRWIAHVTLTGLARELEPASPEPAAAVAGIERLAAKAGDPRRITWRYDPILLGPADRPSQHEERFAGLARALSGHVGRVVVSFLDLYRKTERRLRAAGYPHSAEDGPARGSERRALLARLSGIAADHGLALEVCAEPESYAAERAPAARCVDPALLAQLFPERSFPSRKDPGQRGHCGCAPSVDLGVPDTCPRGCVYCYATRTERLGRERHLRHDPGAESLFEVAPSAPEHEIPRREDAEGQGEDERENPRLPGL
jgi:DNA repair photolyase